MRIDILPHFLYDIANEIECESRFMKTTMKELAYLAGVSRSTVDRVLNKRGKVDAQKAQRIIALAETMGYCPNIVARTLATSKKTYTIGCIPTFVNVDFCNEINRGIEAAAKETSVFGLATDVRPLCHLDVDAQLKLIGELVQSNIQGMIITPINDGRIAQALQGLVDAGIPVIALTADIENVDYASFVGIKHEQSGRIAGNLLSLVAGGQSLRILPVVGSSKMLGHEQRVNGLRKYLQEKEPKMTLCDVVENQDDDMISYVEVSRFLKQTPHVDAIFFAGAGIDGGLRAANEFCISKHPHIIGYDLEIKASYRERLLNGQFLCSLSQMPYNQGYEAVKLISENLINGIKPQGRRHYMKTDVILPESLADKLD